MGVLRNSSHCQNCIKYTNKIPVYAREYKKEYLYIRGINKELQSFIRIDDPEGKKFSSPKADRFKRDFNRFVKAQENGRLKKDISHLRLKETDVNFIDFLEIEFDDYGVLFYEIEAYPRYINENDKIKYDEFVESYYKFKDQLKTDSDSDSDSEDVVIILPDSDSDSDSDSDIEDVKIILPDSDSDSYSYSDIDIEDEDIILPVIDIDSDSDSNRDSDSDIF